MGLGCDWRSCGRNGWRRGRSCRGGWRGRGDRGGWDGRGGCRWRTPDSRQRFLPRPAALPCLFPPPLHLDSGGQTAQGAGRDSPRPAPVRRKPHSGRPVSGRQPLHALAENAGSGHTGGAGIGPPTQASTPKTFSSTLGYQPHHLVSLQICFPPKDTRLCA